MTTISELERRALAVREHIIRMATDGGCFIGASLSCADLIVYLYSCVLDVQPDRTDDPDRDYFLLSKGHDVPALYGTLAELGFLPKERLSQHLSTTDTIYWHPNRSVPGIEFHSGSLGHLLAVAIGIALDIRLVNGTNRVFVLLGDGELNEGSVWEGLLVAAAKRLTNLVLIVDRNGFQANVPTEELIPLEPLEPKFEAMGWRVHRVNGHDFRAMQSVFEAEDFGRAGKPEAGKQVAGKQEARPEIVIADTIRGKGLPSIEARADRWFVNFSHTEVEMLLAELRGSRSAELTSPALMVR